MAFDSFSFFLFFALVASAFFLLRSWPARKGLLLAASYLFYSIWNPPFVILLFLSTVLDWFFAKGAYEGRNLHIRRVCLCSSVVVNLGLLGFFKYGSFVLENFVAVLNALGIDYSPAAPSIILPVGISFYTFQTLSYTLDCYFKKSEPGRSFLDYALYVSFFPQLVAGPIVRSDAFLPQCKGLKRWSADNLGWGMALLTVGVFLKNVLADAIFAPVANAAFEANSVPGTLEAWSGVLAFAGQIFCDFAGYTACAIGIARILGFSLPRNFHSPYAAIGFSDFWRRWHISLSTWLRDYLYIPLGGNRRGDARTITNLMITMLIGGLWHGASWTFVVWGALHGVLLVGERQTVKRLGNAQWALWSGTRLVLWAGTFIAICFTWVFFRASSFRQAYEFCVSMLGFRLESAGVSTDEMVAVLSFFVLLGVHLWNRHTEFESRVKSLPWWTTGIVGGGMIYLIVTMPSADQTFIYFQF